MRIERDNSGQLIAYTGVYDSGKLIPSGLALALVREFADAIAHATAPVSQSGLTNWVPKHALDDVQQALRAVLDLDLDGSAAHTVIESARETLARTGG